MPLHNIHYCVGAALSGCIELPVMTLFPLLLLRVKQISALLKWSGVFFLFKGNAQLAADQPEFRLNRSCQPLRSIANAAKGEVNDRVNFAPIPFVFDPQASEQRPFAPIDRRNG